MSATVSPRYKTTVTDTTDQGIVHAIVSTWDTDQEKEQFVPGAFSSSIRALQASHKTLPVLRQHDWKGPALGYIEPADMKETQAGLDVVIHFDLSSEAGRSAFASVKSRSITEFSVGFVRPKSFMKGSVRMIQDCDLAEVSLVIRGMNPNTRVLSAKGFVGTWPDAEERAAVHVALIKAKGDVGTLRFLAGQHMARNGEQTIYDAPIYRHLGDHIVKAAQKALIDLAGQSPQLPEVGKKNAALLALTSAARDLDIPDDLVREGFRRVAVAPAAQAEEVVGRAIADFKKIADAKENVRLASDASRLAIRARRQAEARGERSVVGISPNGRPIYAPERIDEMREREEKAAADRRVNDEAKAAQLKRHHDADAAHREAMRLRTPKANGGGAA